MRLKEGGALDHTWSTDPWNVLGFIIVAKSVNGFKEEGDSSFCIFKHFGLCKWVREAQK